MKCTTCDIDGVACMTYGQICISEMSFFCDEAGKDDTVGNVKENKNLITSALCSLSSATFRCVSLRQFFSVLFSSDFAVTRR